MTRGSVEGCELKRYSAGMRVTVFMAFEGLLCIASIQALIRFVSGHPFCFFTQLDERGEFFFFWEDRPIRSFVFRGLFFLRGKMLKPPRQTFHPHHGEEPLGVLTCDSYNLPVAFPFIARHVRPLVLSLRALRSYIEQIKTADAAVEKARQEGKAAVEEVQALLSKEAQAWATERGTLNSRLEEVGPVFFCHQVAAPRG